MDDSKYSFFLLFLILLPSILLLVYLFFRDKNRKSKIIVKKKQEREAKERIEREKNQAVSMETDQLAEKSPEKNTEGVAYVSPYDLESFESNIEIKTDDDSISSYRIDAHGIPVEFTIKTSKLIVIDHKDHQQSSSPLQPFPIEWINGYVSPSGGYVNFSRYEVHGLNSKTNRKNKFVCEAISEEEAIKMAQIKKSLSPPFTINIIPNLSPPDYQLAYAKDLGISVPDGACYHDVRALIARVRNHDEEIPDKQTVIDAFNHNIMFSRFSGKQEIRDKQISKRDSTR